ncbi:uncharacterized protein LOC119990098 [Tripterygium wilfordii]|uniref:uncharacterized protein LOC119990098 n=1 Tax=Tripterygium wilfordii TaxID=458696 RepID=UPI0018F7EC19|nr:uncharacterized protein LOC119990098 [Tripterygium wilfordii]
MHIYFKTMKPLPMLSLRSSAPRNTGLKLRRSTKSHVKRRIIKRKIRQLREEMAEISKEQRCIREGQRRVRERLEENQSQREKLKQETELIAKDSINIQMKLNLMFGIINARAQKDSALVARLTCSLRYLISE